MHVFRDGRNIGSECYEKNGRVHPESFNIQETIFLKLTTVAIRDINNERDENGIAYTRKGIIRTVLAKNLDNQWEEAQLFPNIQKVGRKYHVVQL